MNLIKESIFQSPVHIMKGKNDSVSLKSYGRRSSAEGWRTSDKNDSKLQRVQLDEDGGLNLPAI